jgi:hypothetical protein
MNGKAAKKARKAAVTLAQTRHASEENVFLTKGESSTIELGNCLRWWGKITKAQTTQYLASKKRR